MDNILYRAPLNIHFDILIQYIMLRIIFKFTKIKNINTIKWILNWWSLLFSTQQWHLILHNLVNDYLLVEGQYLYDKIEL